MRHFRLSGWVLAVVALLSLPSMLTSATRLNTSWLVPTGNIKVDYNVLGKPDMKVCALTFDDGPDTKFTPAVAAILDKYSVKATFFVVGHRVDSNPKGATALINAGHEIGNHTQSHPDMSSLGASQQAAQIGQLQKSLDKLGVTPTWFRPPYGKFNSSTVKAASKAGMETVLWTVDPRDWQLPGSAKITQRVLSGTVPGAVILLHSTNAQTVEALPGIIEGLQKKGYHFLTMTQWHAAVTGGAMPVMAAAQPAAAAGPAVVEDEPLTTAPAPSAAPAARSAAPAPVSNQGAPRLLPPFTRSDDKQSETNAEESSPETISSTEAVPESPALATAPQAEPPVAATSVAPLSSSSVTSSANFDGPESAWGIWQNGESAGWNVWQSSVQASGGPLAYALAQANPVAAPAREVAPPAPATSQTLPATTYPMLGSEAWRGAAWSPESPLTLEAVLDHEQELRHYRHRPAPSFLLHCASAPEDAALWDKLADYQKLARLDGLLLGSQVPAGSVPLSGPLPRTQADSSSLFDAAMLDPGLQGAARALDVLMAGSNNIYITVRPGNLAGFEPGSLGRGQRELLLLSRLIQGMSFDAAPEADFAADWPLPPGVRMARFYSATDEVFALYCPEEDCGEFALPSAAGAYRVATLNRENNLVLSPLNMKTVDLGSNALLLYREF